MKTSEIIDKAADEMLIRGWTTGGGGWMRGNKHDAYRAVCLEGALMAATGYHMTRDGNEPSEFLKCPAYLAVKGYMLRELPQDELSEFIHDFHIMFVWNDNRGTQDTAIELLRGAAKYEREKEAAADARAS